MSITMSSMCVSVWLCVNCFLVVFAQSNNILSIVCCRWRVFNRIFVWARALPSELTAVAASVRFIIGNRCRRLPHSHRRRPSICSMNWAMWPAALSAVMMMAVAAIHLPSTLMSYRISHRWQLATTRTTSMIHAIHTFWTRTSIARERSTCCLHADRKCFNCRLFYRYVYTPQYSIIAQMLRGMQFCLCIFFFIVDRRRLTYWLVVDMNRALDMERLPISVRVDRKKKFEFAINANI